jgi:hypothetical protein
LREKSLFGETAAQGRKKRVKKKVEQQQIDKTADASGAPQATASEPPADDATSQGSA